MTYSLFVTVFSTVLLAELGDKTQLATFLYAADAENSAWVVFAAASLALVVASGLGVVFGAWIATRVDARLLQSAAGVGFIAVGAWTLLRAHTGES